MNDARLEFRIVVILTLAIFALVGLVLLFPQAVSSVLGHDVGRHVEGHFRMRHHRIHDVTFGLVVGTAAAGMLAQLRRPPANVSAQLVSVIAWSALILASLIGGRWVFAPLPVLAGLTFAAALLHPTVAGALRSVRLSRVSWPLLLLVVVAAMPLLVHAVSKLALQRRAFDDHALLGHYGFMAAFSFTVIGIGVLTSLRLAGWRLTSLFAGTLPILLGAVSFLYPDVESSLAPAWAAGGIVWGAAFIAAAQWSHRQRAARDV